MVHVGNPNEMARSERFELPTLGIEIRCSIQLSYERLDPRYWATNRNVAIICWQAAPGDVRLGSN